MRAQSRHPGKESLEQLRGTGLLPVHGCTCHRRLILDARVVGVRRGGFPLVWAQLGEGRSAEGSGPKRRLQLLSGTFV